jgi:hypothetical protein
MRHYEILASGAVPWFTNFDGLADGRGSAEVDQRGGAWLSGAARSLPPPSVLAHLPVSLLATYQRLLTSESETVTPPPHSGEASGEGIDFGRFDKELYLQVASVRAAPRDRDCVTLGGMIFM